MSRANPSRLAQSWERDGVFARSLTPLAWLFETGVALRNALYDAGMLRSLPLGLPTVSVGNLSVGGTGKTPLSAWIAECLVTLGLRPAILLRGYGGGDEVMVHHRLVPSAITVADPDRVRGAAKARAAGAQVAVLDDAFQHRRAGRDLDVVLVAAEQRGARRLLPAGPLREPRGALRRADVLVITRKHATIEEGDAAAQEWSAFAPRAAVVVAALRPGELHRVGPLVGELPGARPLTALAGRRLLAISALGSPTAFEAQLARLGGAVESAAFPDHHAFSALEVDALARRAEGVDLAVCTLKDAVKLEGRWPRQAPPLWYLSQVVAVERGEAGFRARLARLAAPSSP
jgi:tetraacyldisaccharide 4'-kinase